MAKLLRITLGLALLAGLFPMSDHMSSMKMTHHMETSTTPQIANSESRLHGSMVDNPSDSCCDVVCQILTVSGFLIPEHAATAPSGDSKQFSNSNPVSRLFYLTALAPPPKG